MADNEKSENGSNAKMSWIKKLVWMVLASVIGAAASFLVPKYLDDIELRSAPVATGEWLSAWRWDIDPEGEWHDERVQIEPNLGKMKLWCTFSPEGNQWEAFGKLVEQGRGTHIVGGWHSVKPGAIASGPFALSTLASHGESMYGYFGDYDDRNGNAVVGTWILGKDSSHFLDAKAWITLHRKPQKRN